MYPLLLDHLMSEHARDYLGRLLNRSNAHTVMRKPTVMWGLLLLICCSSLCRPYDFDAVVHGRMEPGRNMTCTPTSGDHELLVVLVTPEVSTHAARVCHHGVVEKIPRPTHKFMPGFQDGLAHRHGLLRAMANRMWPSMYFRHSISNQCDPGQPKS